MAQRRERTGHGERTIRPLAGYPECTTGPLTAPRERTTGPSTGPFTGPRERTTAPLTVAMLWAVLLVATALILGSCSSSSSSASNDVTVSSCGGNTNGSRPVASGTVVNHSSKASTYAFSITFYDSSGNKVSQGATTLGKVESGATATFTAGGIASANGPLTCKVSSVVRTVAP